MCSCGKRSDAPEALTYTLLSGLKIIEVSAFVAAPLAGLTLAQLGAEVIRIDPVGGGIDRDRWPMSGETSLYWTGLNRAKRSACIDLKSEQGQSLLHRLLQSGGADGGILLTNLTGPDWMAFGRLKQARADLIMVDLKGHYDGATAIDYTVNAGVGVPFATGQRETEGPVNHMLPAWDAVAGLTLATALLAAVRARERTGTAQHLSVALSDVAVGFLANLGIVAEAELTGTDRPRIGNHIYGAFGSDLLTKDGRYLMVAAISAGQWRALVKATGLSRELTEVENRLGLDFSTEHGRYEGREAIADLLSGWSSQRTLVEAMTILERHRVLAGPYRTFTQMLVEDPRVSEQNPMFRMIDHPGVGHYRVPGSPIRVDGLDEGALEPAPMMGQDSRAVASEAGLDANQINDLVARKIVGDNG